MMIPTTPTYADVFHAGQIAEIRTHQMQAPREHDPLVAAQLAEQVEQEWKAIRVAEVVRYCRPTPEDLRYIQLANKHNVHDKLTTEVPHGTSPT